MLALFVGLPLLVVLAGIVALAVFLRRRKGTVRPQEAAVAPRQMLIADLTSLKERDPDFNEDLFIAKVSNIYIQLQESWEAKEWQKVRPFESDELFNMHKRQLQEFIDSNTTNVVDDIAVLKAQIHNYREYGDTETLDVYLKARIKDYVIDDASKKVIEGDPRQEIVMEYILSMSRKKGVLSRSGEGTAVKTCPNCGANISINAAGECKYCGSVVTSGDFDWVLTRLDVLSQT
jgi:predicted lipid-binding transport protein (Tim44 family)